MKELFDALKNQASYTILEDIIKNSYAHRRKDSERANTIPVLLEYGIVEIVEVSEHMLRFWRFDNEKQKQGFIDNGYFLTITEKGKFAFELMKWQKESIARERKRYAEESYNERKRIAKDLLKSVGLELEEFTQYDE